QYLDVEVDAFAIAAMSIMLWQHLDHFSMIIVAGALRYLYVLTIRFFISESRTEPKRQYASFIAVLVYIAMVLELAFHHTLTYLFLILGMLLLTGSFLRSFFYQWRGI
ncbi:MAG: hypothetical protein KTR32_21265, partial [Granulosicoccus sp.]|nr:hypothetical protein [Granulosicoccus sp.]